MLKTIFSFNSVIGGSLNITSVTVCTVASLLLGLFIAYVYTVKSSYTKSFFITLTLLPVIVQSVIMMVNGSIGVGVAVAGAFSLVRFRSVAGSAKDICCIFLAMAIGLATGLGFIFYALLIAVVVAVVFLLLKLLPIANDERSSEKMLRVTIPEDLDYTKEVGDILKNYCSRVTLERTKTTNLGSLFELKYHLVLKRGVSEKQMIDDIREINSNLPISLSVYRSEGNEL